MVAKKQTVSEAIVTGYVNMLKNCSKLGDPGRNAGIYRRDTLAKLEQSDPQLYNAVVKRLGDK